MRRPNWKAAGKRLLYCLYYLGIFAALTIGLGILFNASPTLAVIFGWFYVVAMYTILIVFGCLVIFMVIYGILYGDDNEET